MQSSQRQIPRERKTGQLMEEGRNAQTLLMEENKRAGLRKVQKEKIESTE